MNTNNISQAFKIIMFAISAIIVCVVCVVAIKTTNEGKAMANAGTTQIKEMTENYSDRWASYDSTNLLGSALVDLIEEVIEEDEPLCIRVITSSNGTSDGKDYNRTLITGSNANSFGTGTAEKKIEADLSSPNYINPNAQFAGKVYKDANKNIIAIEFRQMK